MWNVYMCIAGGLLRFHVSIDVTSHAHIRWSSHTHTAIIYFYFEFSAQFLMCHQCNTLKTLAKRWSLVDSKCNWNSWNNSNVMQLQSTHNLRARKKFKYKLTHSQIHCERVWCGVCKHISSEKITIAGYSHC